jgi:hypothetical protein
MYQRVKGIMEAAGLDPEKMMAPKNVWFDDKRLEEWYDSREKLRESKREAT